MSIRLKLASQCEAVNFVVAYGPTGCAKDVEQKHYFRHNVEDVVEIILTKEYLFVLMDANTQTGQSFLFCFIFAHPIHYLRASSSLSPSNSYLRSGVT